MCCPLITKRKLYSQKLVNLQFGLVMIGLTGFFFVLTIAGFIQGSAWQNGEVVYQGTSRAFSLHGSSCNVRCVHYCRGIYRYV